MPVTFDLPPELEQSLRADVHNIDLVAKEAFAVELYRQRRITQHQLARVLGLNRLQTDGVLKRHGVYYDQTIEDVCREAESLEAARGKC